MDRLRYCSMFVDTSSNPHKIKNTNFLYLFSVLSKIKAVAARAAIIRVISLKLHTA